MAANRTTGGGGTSGTANTEEGGPAPNVNALEQILDLEEIDVYMLYHSIVLFNRCIHLFCGRIGQLISWSFTKSTTMGTCVWWSNSCTSTCSMWSNCW
jgi:hypothetical protein